MEHTHSDILIIVRVGAMTKEGTVNELLYQDLVAVTRRLYSFAENLVIYVSLAIQIMIVLQSFLFAPVASMMDIATWVRSATLVLAPMDINNVHLVLAKMDAAYKI